MVLFFIFGSVFALHVTLPLSWTVDLMKERSLLLLRRSFCYLQMLGFCCKTKLSFMIMFCLWFMHKKACTMLIRNIEILASEEIARENLYYVFDKKKKNHFGGNKHLTVVF